LLRGTEPQIVRAVVERVPVAVVNEQPGRGKQQEPMKNKRPSFASTPTDVSRCVLDVDLAGLVGFLLWVPRDERDSLIDVCIDECRPRPPELEFSGFPNNPDHSSRFPGFSGNEKAQNLREFL
jgi:hypothetical protein